MVIHDVLIVRAKKRRLCWTRNTDFATLVEKSELRLQTSPPIVWTSNCDFYGEVGARFPDWLSDHLVSDWRQENRRHVRDDLMHIHTHTHTSVLLLVSIRQNMIRPL